MPSGKCRWVGGQAPIQISQNAGKQGKHVVGHKNDNDPKRSKWRLGENGVRQTQEAWKNSHQPNPKNPNVRIGQSSDGRIIKIHIGQDGIHGYPIFH